MRRLDSPFSTSWNKWTVYIFLALVWGMTIKSFVDGNHRMVPMYYILPPFSAIVLWWLSSFKQVTLDGDALIIRDFRREARIPVSRIGRVVERPGGRGFEHITIVFKSKTEFGRRVRIMTGISVDKDIKRITKMLRAAMTGTNSGVKIVHAPREPERLTKPSNEIEVVVRGWTSEELSGILTDFSEMSNDDLGPEFGFEVHPDNNDSISITFPHDIPAQQFSYLINYVQYPKNYNLKGRSISVVGKALITPDFHPPSKDLLGQKAIFYIPSNDQQYDLVYVRVGNDTFENSFAARRWKKVSNSRIPSGVEIKE